MFTNITGYFTGKTQEKAQVPKQPQEQDDDYQVIGIFQSVHSKEQKQTKKLVDKPLGQNADNQEADGEQQMIVVKQSNDFGEYGQKNQHIYPTFEQKSKATQIHKEQPDCKKKSIAKVIKPSVPANYYDLDVLNQSFSDLNSLHQRNSNIFTSDIRSSNPRTNQEQVNSESFSGIFDAVQQFDDCEDDQPPQIKKKTKKSDTQLTQQQRMKKMFTQSIRQENYEPIGNKLSLNKQKQPSDQKKVQIKPKKQDKTFNPNQSRYLQKVQDENTRKQNLQKKRESFNQVRVQKIDKYFIFKFQNSTVQITTDIMNQITEEFLKLQILIPLMHQKVYEKKHALCFFKRLTDFINAKTSEQFIKIIKNLTQKSNRKDFKKKKHENTIFDSFIYTFTQKYSKTEKVYESVIAKVQTLKALKELSNIASLEKQIQQNQQLLGCLELLLCFQRAQNFCKQKIEKSDIEKNIWMSRKNQLIKDRNWWVTNVFPKVYI